MVTHCGIHHAGSVFPVDHVHETHGIQAMLFVWGCHRWVDVKVLESCCPIFFGQVRIMTSLWEANRMTKCGSFHWVQLWLVVCQQGLFVQLSSILTRLLLSARVDTCVGQRFVLLVWFMRCQQGVIMELSISCLQSTKGKQALLVSLAFDWEHLQKFEQREA